MFWFVVILVLLILVSAFFSAAETGMMSINRYRLRHRASAGDKAAQRVYNLLKRPDRLLGVILIGNTFANVFVSSIATIISVKLFGEIGVAIGGFVISLIILIYSEVTPKTLAALHPESVAYRCSILLNALLKLLYPLVWIVNTISNATLGLFRVTVKGKAVENLSYEELKTLIGEAIGKSAHDYQGMLLGILDLGEVTVEDIMVPRSEIIGIDLNQSMEAILKQLENSQHTRLLMYRDSIDNTVGLLHVRRALHLFAQGKMSKESLVEVADEIHFIPEATPLINLLVNLRKQKCRIGLVVDEYGDILGLATLEDILEEIVGEFTTDFAKTIPEVWPQKDGSFIVEGGANIRELNRSFEWELPIGGAKTISGLIVDELEMIPQNSLCLRIAGYPIEVIKIEANMIDLVRIYPQLYKKPD
jgi:Mg2+/Co2+ transporter CorB